MTIQTTICYKCGIAYTCIGKTQRTYKNATVFVKFGNVSHPVCSDKEACESRMQKGEKNINVVWTKTKGK